MVKMEHNQVIEGASYYYYSFSDCSHPYDGKGDRKVNTKYYTSDGDIITTRVVPYTEAGHGLDLTAPKPKIAKYHIYYRESINFEGYGCCVVPGYFIVFVNKHNNEMLRKGYFGDKPPKPHDLQHYNDYNLQTAIYHGYDESERGGGGWGKSIFDYVKNVQCIIM